MDDADFTTVDEETVAYVTADNPVGPEAPDWLTDQKRGEQLRNRCRSREHFLARLVEVTVETPLWRDPPPVPADQFRLTPSGAESTMSDVWQAFHEEKDPEGLNLVDRKNVLAWLRTLPTHGLDRLAGAFLRETEHVCEPEDAEDYFLFG
jgi:hypothetical protein